MLKILTNNLLEEETKSLIKKLRKTQKVKVRLHNLEFEIVEGSEVPLLPCKNKN